MEWHVKIHRKVLHFLESLLDNRRRLVEGKLEELVDALEQSVLPYNRSSIRCLKGEWGGFGLVR